MDAIKLMSQDSLKAEKPVFEIGDTVRVHVRIVEGSRSRIQVYEGIVIAMKHGGVSHQTFHLKRFLNGTVQAEL